MNYVLVQTKTQSFLNQVYSWMGAGLLITAAVAWFTASTPTLLAQVIDLRIPLLLLQVGLVMALSFLLPRMSSTVAGAMFLAYSLLMGVTLSVVFLAYTSESIAAMFLISAGMFFGLSVFGYLTKANLSTVGQIATMALIGLIVCMLVNLFLQSTALSWWMSVATVFIFTALTAYDTQKLKNMALSGFENGESAAKMAIYGALILYLDFINLFLALLRLFGSRR
jgi:uncharacterized protein